MSQQPRRKRRKRRGRGGQGKKPQQQQESASQRSQGERSQQQPKAEGGSRRRRRRGRSRSRGGGERSITPAKSSEDIVRAHDRKRPDTLMLPPDDRKLEDIIGSLQSEMGVPQNPQEYRLTVKIAEERDNSSRSHKPSEVKAPNGEPDGKPRREKAPAAPNVGGGDAPAAQREKAPSRKRRSRRRRRGGRGSGGSGANGGGASKT
jgi:hypothetical protein